MSSTRVAGVRGAAVRRVLKWLGAAAAVLVAVIVVAIGALHTAPGRRFVLSRITELLAAQQIDLRADQLRYNLFDLSLDLRDVTIRSARSAEDPPFAVLAGLTANLSLMDLLGGRYVVESAALDGARVHYLVRRRRRQPAAASARPQGAQPAGGLPGRQPLGNQRDRPVQNRAQQIDVIMPVPKLSVRGDRLTDRHAISLSAQDGRLRAEGRDMRVTALSADFSLGDDDVDIVNARVEAEASRVEVEGTLDHFADPTIAARVRATLERRTCGTAGRAGRPGERTARFRREGERPGVGAPGGRAPGRSRAWLPRARCPVARRASGLRRTHASGHRPESARQRAVGQCHGQRRRLVLGHVIPRHVILRRAIAWRAVARERSRQRTRCAEADAWAGTAAGRCDHRRWHRRGAMARVPLRRGLGQRRRLPDACPGARVAFDAAGGRTHGAERGRRAAERAGRQSQSGWRACERFGVADRRRAPGGSAARQRHRHRVSGCGRRGLSWTCARLADVVAHLRAGRRRRDAGRYGRAPRGIGGHRGAGVGRGTDGTLRVRQPPAVHAPAE